MRKKGLTYRIAGEINNTEALKNFAREDGENFAVISALAVDESIRVVDIPGLDLGRSFDIVYHRDKTMSPPMRELMAICLRPLERQPDGNQARRGPKADKIA